MAMARQEVCAVVIRTIRAESRTRPDALSSPWSEPGVRADDEGALELRGMEFLINVRRIIGNP